MSRLRGLRLFLPGIVGLAIPLAGLGALFFVDRGSAAYAAVLFGVLGYYAGRHVEAWEARSRKRRLAEFAAAAYMPPPSAMPTARAMLGNWQAVCPLCNWHGPEGSYQSALDDAFGHVHGNARPARWVRL